MTRLLVELLDAHDEASFAAYHGLSERAERAAYQWKPSFYSLDEWRRYFGTPTADTRDELFVARVAGTGAIVGGGNLAFPLLDNLDTAWFVIAVDPAHQSCGVGTALLRFAEERALTAGRHTLHGGTEIRFGHEGEHPRIAWLAREGYAVYASDRYSQLTLPTPAGLLASLSREAAAAHHSAYEIVTCRETLPAALVEGYCAVQNQLVADAPTGTLSFEEERLTPAAWRERNARSRQMGRHNLFTLAVGGGEVVAHTDAFVTPDGRRAVQAGTIVAREHRGHRLGLAIKCANLLALEADHPECVVIDTTTNSANAPMHAVNDRLGFRPVAEAVQVAKRLVR